MKTLLLSLASILFLIGCSPSARLDAPPAPRSRYQFFVMPSSGHVGSGIWRCDTVTGDAAFAATLPDMTHWHPIGSTPNSFDYLDATNPVTKSP